MAKNGAKYFLMLSRQGRNAAGAEDFIEEMSAAGVHIDAPACDITIALSVREAVEATTRANMPPIKGCIQAAMVIRVSELHRSYGDMCSNASSGFPLQHNDV